MIAACLLAAGCAAVGRHAPIRVEDYGERIRVACVGNSITFGEKIGNRERDSYPAQLGRMLGSKWEVRNFGHSGATMLRRSPLPYWTQAEFKDVLAYDPNVVVILLGTNDSRPFIWKEQTSFERDYEDMIDAFAQLPAAPRIWICDPPPLMNEPRDAWAQTLERQVIPIIDRVGEQKRVPVIDLYHPLRDQPELFPDLVHPNAEGARRIAGEIYRALTGEEAEP